MDHEPTPAEQLRSLLRTASSIDMVTAGDRVGAGRRVSLLDSHTFDLDGRLLVAVPGDSALAIDLYGGSTRVRIEVTDVAPVAMRDRIRARAVLTGRLSVTAPRAPGDPGMALVTVLDLSGAELVERDAVTAVEPAQLAAAEPDVLASRESALLCHLVDAHADMVAWLSRLVPAGRLHGVRRVHPWRLDRYGIVLRLEFPSADREARLPFAAPLRDAEEAPTRMLELLARARTCRRRVA
jgi:hypothetical protein